MRAAVVAALALLLAAPAGAQETAQAPAAPTVGGAIQLSLEGAVARAVERNEEVLIALAEEARTDGLIREISAGAWPSLTAAGNYTRNIERPVFFFNSPEGLQRIEVGSDNEIDLSARLRQTLYDPALGPAVRAARLAREAAAAGTERVRTLIALEARLRYFDALFARDLVRVREQAVAQAEARLDQVRAFRDAGTAAEFDLLTAEVEAANLRPPLIEARNERELAVNRLKRVVGLPLAQPVELTDGFPAPAAEGPLSEPELGAAVAAALDGRSDLATQRLVVELEEQRVTAERRSVFPTLDLTADYLRRASTDDFPGEDDFVDSVAAGVAFEIDVFDGGERRGRVAQAEASLERERQRLSQLSEGVRLEVEQAYRTVRAAREWVIASRDTVARAEKALEIAQLRFRNGLSTQLELDDAELAVTEARTNLARSLHAHATAQAELQAATGER
ncbi:MAG TPA: TolC family protein [Thermoanaerobaculia bacterium]|nr:TolC family protein [Thermoanaerobaculia bacterium]